MALVGFSLHGPRCWTISTLISKEKKGACCQHWNLDFNIQIRIRNTSWICPLTQLVPCHGYSRRQREEIISPWKGKILGSWLKILSRIFLLKSHLDWRPPLETQFYYILLISNDFCLPKSYVFVVLPARQLTCSFFFWMLLAKKGGWSLKQIRISVYHAKILFHIPVWERTPRGQRISPLFRRP